VQLSEIPVKLVLEGIGHLAAGATATPTSCATGQRSLLLRGHAAVLVGHCSAVDVLLGFTQQPVAHLNVRGIGTPQVTYAPGERSTDRIGGANPMCVFDELLGGNRSFVGLIDAGQFLSRLEDGRGQYELRIL